MQKPSQRSPLASLLFLALAILFAALAVGPVSSPSHKHVVLDFLRKGFGVGFFGSLAAGSAFATVHAWRGQRRVRPSLPQSLAELCPGCGRTISTEAELCPSCSHPLRDQRKFWGVSDRALGEALFFLAITLAFLCLGGFVALGPALEGERRLWVNLAAASLGLVIGGAFVWVSVDLLREALSGRRTWGYNRSFDVPHGDAYTKVTAVVQSGRLLSVSGRTNADERPPEVDRPALASCSPQQRCIAHALAALNAAELLSFNYELSRHWDLIEPPLPGHSPRIERTEKRQVWLSFKPAPPDASEDLRRISAAIVQCLTEYSSLSLLWSAVSTDPELQEAFESFASDEEPSTIEALLLQELAEEAHLVPVADGRLTG